MIDDPSLIQGMMREFGVAGLFISYLIWERHATIKAQRLVNEKLIDRMTEIKTAMIEMTAKIESFSQRVGGK